MRNIKNKYIKKILEKDLLGDSPTRSSSIKLLVKSYSKSIGESASFLQYIFHKILLSQLNYD